MAETKDGCARSDKRDRRGKRAGPEEDWMSVLWQRMAKQSLDENAAEVIFALVFNIRELKHIPSLKLLLAIAYAFRREVAVPAEEYRGLAEMLWESLPEEERKVVNEHWAST